MPRMRVLLDLTHVYDEEGGVEEIGADPNVYSDQAPPSGDPPPFPTFLPGYALEIPEKIEERRRRV